MVHTHIFHRLLALWNVLAASLILVIAFSYYVPYNMDEFIHYDTITCHWYPGNDWDHKCDSRQLNVLNTGLVLPLRAFDYAGSFPALYFLPFHLLWKSPLMARWVSLSILLLGGWVLARYAKLKPRWVIGGMLLCFPYAFQHLSDTGPIGFHILSVYLLAAIFRKWCETLQTRYAALTGLLLFLSIWTKLVYFWLFPSLFLLFLGEVWSHRVTLFRYEQRKRFLGQCFLAALMMVLLLATLFLSTSPADQTLHPYWDIMWKSGSFTLREMLSGAWVHQYVAEAFIHPILATQRIFMMVSVNPLSLAYSWLVYGFTPVALLVALRIGVPRRTLIRPAGLYALFLLAVFMILRTKMAWAMHHALLSYPFLMLSVASVIRIICDHPVCSCVRTRLKRAFWLVVAAYVAINLTFTHIAISQHTWSASDMTRDIAREVINMSDVHSRYVISILDWGLYYEQGLFGHDDQSVYFDSALRDPARVDELAAIARKHGRKMMFVWSGSSADLDLLKSKFNLVRCEAFPDWAWWQILAEPDPSYTHACQAGQALRQDHSFSSSTLLRIAEVL